MGESDAKKIIESLDEQKLAESAAQGWTSTVQFWKPDYHPALLLRIDELCQKYGVRVKVRFFNHIKEVFDASILSQLPSVQNLAVDCMEHIKNEDQIAALSHLRRLSFQVTGLDRPEFLSRLNLANLEALTLMGTYKANLNLKPVSKAPHLRKLTVEGHRRNIESLSEAPRLEQLALWAQPRSQSLAFLTHVPTLRALGIIRGGRETLDLTHDGLEYLNVTWVNGMHDLGPIRRFPKLKGLVVSDQIRLPSIDLTGVSIKSLALNNCKNLTHLIGLGDATQLEQFTAIKTALPLNELRDRSWPPSLRVLRLWSSSMKWNKATRATLEARGYQEVGERWFQSDLDDFIRPLFASG
jgi:hypothetical protein